MPKRVLYDRDGHPLAYTIECKGCGLEVGYSTEGKHFSLMMFREYCLRCGIKSKAVAKIRTRVARQLEMPKEDIPKSIIDAEASRWEANQYLWEAGLSVKTKGIALRRFKKNGDYWYIRDRRNRDKEIIIATGTTSRRLAVITMNDYKLRMQDTKGAYCGRR